MSEPLAQYNEVRSDGKRHLKLHADRVFVEGVSGQGRFEDNVYLADLRPEPGKLWLRGRLFVLGIILLFLALVLCIPIFVFITEGIERPGSTKYISFVLVLLSAAIFVCFKGYRTIEYARFQSHGGIVLLDIANCGPDQHRFQEFIHLLTNQIRMAQTKNPNSGPASTIA
jgi:hypothetical protein